MGENEMGMNAGWDGSYAKKRIMACGTDRIEANDFKITESWKPLMVALTAGAAVAVAGCVWRPESGKIRTEVQGNETKTYLETKNDVADVGQRLRLVESNSIVTPSAECNIKNEEQIGNNDVRLYELACIKNEGLIKQGSEFQVNIYHEVLNTSGDGSVNPVINAAAGARAMRLIY